MLLQKNQSNKHRDRLLASVRETKLQLLRIYKKLDKLRQRKAHLNRHIIDVCARFTFFTHVLTAEEERKVFVLYSTIEALWKRDGLRIENERKQAEEKKRALTACLARLEKKLRQSSWGASVSVEQQWLTLKSNGRFWRWGSTQTIASGER